jgi:serine/threonine protein kinase
MAPEIILNQNYNEKVDIWSIGVITYMLLTGRNPFPGKDKNEIKNLIVNYDINFKKPIFDKISPEAIDFMNKALNKNH